MWSAMVQSSRNRDPGSNVEAKYSRPSPVAMWGKSWHRATSWVRGSKRPPTRLATDIAVGAGKGSLRLAVADSNAGLTHKAADVLQNAFDRVLYIDLPGRLSSLVGEET